MKLLVLICSIIAAYILWLEFSTPFFGDEVLYLGMGRGLLNGLQMWKDLFETKPPIIYWISAASLLFDSDFLYRLILVSGLVASWWILRSFFGFFLILYVIGTASGYQTEAFAVLPVVLALKYRHNAILLGISLSVLWLLKEPFAFTTSMILLIFSKDWGAVRTIVKACLIGGAVSFVVLLVTGNLENYLTIYLPEMFGGRTASFLHYHDYAVDQFHNVESPLWLRGFNTRKLIENGWLMVMVGTLIVSYLKGQWKSLVFVGLALVLFERVFSVHQVLTILGAVPWHSGYFWWKVVELVLLGVGTGWMAWKSEKDGWRVIAGIYVCLLAAGIGGFQVTHILFALPLWLMLSERLGKAQYILLVVLYPLFTYSVGMITEVQTPVEEYRAEASRIDAMPCPRYHLTLEKAYLPAYTKKSPYQLPYGIVRAKDREIGGQIQFANSYFKNKMERDLAENCGL